MVKINDVYDLAEINAIIVVDFSMKDAKSLSCQAKNGDCYIAIDTVKLETAIEEKVLLAHEVGHCLTGAFYSKDNMLDVRSRHEYRADRWAVKQLIPWHQLKQAFEEGIVEPWQLAEYFNVTEDFIHTAFKIYRAQGVL